MVLEVPAAGVEGVKLDKWFAMPGCQFVRTDDSFTLTLRLADTPCGITRVTNTLTVGRTTAAHSILRGSGHEID
jgi:hypothetical protein